MACGCKNKAAAANNTANVVKNPTNGVIKAKTSSANRTLKREIR